MYKNLSEIDKIFVMDHDFVCIAKQASQESLNLFMQGLGSYLDGDW